MTCHDSYICEKHEKPHDGSAKILNLKKKIKPALKSHERYIDGKHGKPDDGSLNIA